VHGQLNHTWNHYPRLINSNCVFSPFFRRGAHLFVGIHVINDRSMQYVYGSMLNLLFPMFYKILLLQIRGPNEGSNLIITRHARKISKILLSSMT
jgi:hypothetical protein